MYLKRLSNKPHYLNNMNLFKPKEILDIFTDFDVEKHKEDGFKAILLDVDNTIAIPNTGICDDRAEVFIKKLQDNDFIVYIFSNNNEARVLKFIRDLNVNYYSFALKPLPFSFRNIAKKLNIKPSEIIVMGDQLLTDILGANLSGCYGIYCKQLQEKDSFLTSINRRLENIIWRFIK